MMKYQWKEIVASILLIISLVLFLPVCQKIWMPTMFMPTVVFFLVLAFLLFSALMWKESAIDEREELHRSLASRLSFLTGSSLLIAGIVVQTVNETIDPWLVVTLTTMVIVKLIARAYYTYKK